VSWSGFGRGCVMAFSVAIVAGCYVYTPAPTSPAPGTHLMLDVSDRGRVGLGDSIGSSARTIEGTAVSSTDSAYSLRVSRVGYLNGQSNSWTGEPLLVSRSFVTNVRDRRFSKGRTWLAATAVSAAAIAFIATRGLLGFGNSSNNGGGGKPNPE
jgi:hypothetical protein